MALLCSGVEEVTWLMTWKGDRADKADGIVVAALTQVQTWG